MPAEAFGRKLPALKLALTDKAITLSQAFEDEINPHSIPVEREVIAVPASAPGVF